MGLEVFTDPVLGVHAGRGHRPSFGLGWTSKDDPVAIAVSASWPTLSSSTTSLDANTPATTSDDHLALLARAERFGSDRRWAVEDRRGRSRRRERELLAAGEPIVRVPPQRMAWARDSARPFGTSDPMAALAVARAAPPDRQPPGSTPPSPLAIIQAHHLPPARQFLDRRAAGDTISACSSEAGPTSSPAPLVDAYQNPPGGIIRPVARHRSKRTLNRHSRPGAAGPKAPWRRRRGRSRGPGSVPELGPAGPLCLACPTSRRSCVHRQVQLALETESLRQHHCQGFSEVFRAPNPSAGTGGGRRRHDRHPAPRW